MANKFSEFKADPNKIVNEMKKENPEKVEDVEKLMEKYKNLSQQELMLEFLKESKKKKEKGELNKDSISQIKQTLTPFLNAEQQANLETLMGMIDDN